MKFKIGDRVRINDECHFHDITYKQATVVANHMYESEFYGIMFEDMEENSCIDWNSLIMLHNCDDEKLESKCLWVFGSDMDLVCSESFWDL